MVFEKFDEKEEEQSRYSYFDSFKTREEELKEVNTGKKYDVLVIGGGIHGSTFARIVAFNGLRVLLLELKDFGHSTSSSSSKLAHGGLRYLENLDFIQVLEGVKAREELINTANHLVYPYPFLLPIFEKSKFSRFKIKLGLCIYDYFLKNKSNKNIFKLFESTDCLKYFRERVFGAFQYFDAIMEDQRLVIENIIQATQEGARCLNYCRVDSVRKEKDDLITVGFSDLLNNKKIEAKCGIVVNCAGSLAPFIGTIRKEQHKVQYSKGTHIIFNKKWENPALIIPMKEKGRYYFVLPHFSGTLVGTTEKSIKHPELQQTPSLDEINEIIQRLEKDIPYAGLNKEHIQFVYAGLRTLPVRGTLFKKNTSKLSRKHKWEFNNTLGMLTLYGGKYTTSLWTSFEGVKKMWKISGLFPSPNSVSTRKLPGAFNDGEKISLIEMFDDANIPEHIYDRLLYIYGRRCKYFFEDDGDLKIVDNFFIRGEFKLAFKVDKAKTAEDFIFRRVLIHYRGIDFFAKLNEINEELSKYILEDDLKKQLKECFAKIELSSNFKEL